MTVEAESVIKPGDIFEISVEAVEPRPDGKWLITTPTSGYTTIDAYLLHRGRRVEHPLAVGDRVKFKADRVSGFSQQYRGGIVAIRGGDAFVDWNGWKPEPAARWSLSELERAPAEGKDQP